MASGGAVKEARPRISIVISDEDQNRLNRLSVLLEGATTTDVVKRSLKMNEFILEKIKSGGTIKVVDADGHETVLAVL